MLRGAPLPAMLRGAPLPAMLRGAPLPAMLRGAPLPAMLRGAPLPAMLRGAPLPAMLRTPLSVATAPYDVLHSVQNAAPTAIAQGDLFKMRIDFPMLRSLFVCDFLWRTTWPAGLKRQLLVEKVEDTHARYHFLFRKALRLFY
jgi:hypothetical protein